MLTKETTRVIQPVKSFFKNFFQKKVPSQKVVDNLYGKYEVVRPWVVSKMNKVPSYIPQPSYSESSIPAESPTASEIKDKNQIECMKHSCILAKKVLNQAGQFIKPGVTTDELDQKLHEMIINNCAYPSPLNYLGFPKSICTSINNVACHGIPDNRPLQEGDILNVDVTVYLNGYHGDCSMMYEVGEVDDEAKRLIKVTEECLRTAIDICKPNENFSSIGKITEEIANKHGFNIVPAFAGHGIGNYFHGPPEILHYANKYGGQMEPGMTFTIEPVLTQGGPQVEILEDGWTAVTVDDARTAQIEHTVLITDTGCEILTY